VQSFFARVILLVFLNRSISINDDAHCCLLLLLVVAFVVVVVVLGLDSEVAIGDF